MKTLLLFALALALSFTSATAALVAVTDNKGVVFLVQTDLIVSARPMDGNPAVTEVLFRVGKDHSERLYLGLPVARFIGQLERASKSVDLIQRPKPESTASADQVEKPNPTP